MGCGCKGKNVRKINQETGDLEPLGFGAHVSKIITGLLLTSILIILSPLILVAIWVMLIRAIYDKESDIIGLINKAYNRKKLLRNKKLENDTIEDDSDDFNPEDYELLDVDIIK